MIGLLVMAYGGPNNLEEVEPYLMDVRGYRPTAPEIVHEVRERYHEIGGRSPILERTWAQAHALESALNTNGQNFKAFVGMRHWHPFIKDTLAEMCNQRIERAVGLVMAPHYSRMSIEAYFKNVEQAESSIQITRINDWHLLPEYLIALAKRVHSALERFPESVRAEVPIIFTAHSLPERILEWDDPYPKQLRETVEALMELLGPQPHEFAFQSAAISTEPWLVVCEHVEILYDIDIVYQNLSKTLGVHLERIEMLNDEPEMISGLARLVRSAAKESNWL